MSRPAAFRWQSAPVQAREVVRFSSPAWRNGPQAPKTGIPKMFFSEMNSKNPRKRTKKRRHETQIYIGTEKNLRKTTKTRKETRNTNVFGEGEETKEGKRGDFYVLREIACLRLKQLPPPSFSLKATFPIGSYPGILRVPEVNQKNSRKKNKK